MEEFRFMRLGAVVVVLLAAVAIGGPVSCTLRQSQLVADMIARGTDPIAAHCAIYGTGGSGAGGGADAQCLIYAAGRH